MSRLHPPGGPLALELLLLPIVGLGCLGILLLAWVIATANGLIAKRNAVTSVFSTIDVLLKKRYDLIPNLVNVVKGYTAHESQTLEEVVRLRNQAMAAPHTAGAGLLADTALGQVLGQFMGLVEAYPDLKADRQFLRLQAALNEVEEQLSAARRAYNAAVLDYNNAVQMFPSNLIAGILGHRTIPFFAATADERQLVDITGTFHG
ncbi:MAG TPA: LemA family protein [bacterium]|nr:LemA family protein [bacterium]